MNLWDYVFGRGTKVQRDGPAHSSDRVGFWKDLYQLRNHLGLDPDHSGSIDIYDHFGCDPHNDNEIKRERRDQARPILGVLTVSRDPQLREHAMRLLVAFEVADERKGWRT